MLPFVLRRTFSDRVRLAIERVASGAAVLIGVGLALKPIGTVGTIIIVVQQLMASTFAVAPTGGGRPRRARSSRWLPGSRA